MRYVAYTNDMTIRKVIQKRMDELNINANQLSNMLNGKIPRRTIYDFLSGKTDARTEVASVLMETLGLEIRTIKKGKRPRKEK